MRTELTDAERAVLEADAARWHRMGSGAHLEDWLHFQEGLAIRRRLAMRLSNSNAPKGKRYNETFAKLLAQDGFDHNDKAVKQAFTALLSLTIPSAW